MSIHQDLDRARGHIVRLKQQVGFWQIATCVAAIIAILAILMLAVIMPDRINDQRELSAYYERYGALR